MNAEDLIRLSNWEQEVLHRHAAERLLEEMGTVHWEEGHWWLECIDHELKIVDQCRVEEVLPGGVEHGRVQVDARNGRSAALDRWRFAGGATGFIGHLSGGFAAEVARCFGVFQAGQRGDGAAGAAVRRRVTPTSVGA